MQKCRTTTWKMRKGETVCMKKGWQGWGVQCLTLRPVLLPDSLRFLNQSPRDTVGQIVLGVQTAFCVVRQAVAPLASTH